MANWRGDIQQAARSATAVMVNGNTIFTITGGPIIVYELFSICITTNDATASTLQYQSNATVGGNLAISGATATLASATAGTIAACVWGTLATAPVIVAAGAQILATVPVLVPAGAITIVIGVGSTTGTWEHHIRYAAAGPARVAVV